MRLCAVVLFVLSGIDLLCGAVPISENPLGYYSSFFRIRPEKRYEHLWRSSEAAAPPEQFVFHSSVNQQPPNTSVRRTSEAFVFSISNNNKMGGYDNKTKLDLLRKELARYDLDAYLVPTTDSHDSEYPVPADARREYISGFTGSAGTAVVEMTEAHLWTDGRYFLQAERQLDGSLWQLKRAGTPGCPTITEFLNSRGNDRQEDKPYRVGFDPYVHTVKWLNDVTAELKGDFVKLVPIHRGSVPGATEGDELALMQGIEKGQDNLVDRVWNSDGTRPKYPSVPVVLMKNEYAGETVSDKLNRLRSTMAERKMATLMVAALGEVAWLFNLRGLDAPYSRIFLSYAVITHNEAFLYLNVVDRLEKDARKALEADGVKIKDYVNIAGDLPTIIKKAQTDSARGVWIDSSVNVALNKLAKSSVMGTSSSSSDDESGVLYLEETSPIWSAKGVKNSTELAGMIDAHLEDASAVIVYLAWLDSLAPSVMRRLTESTASDKLDYFRSIQPNYVALSFPSISGVDDNSAVIHYRAEPSTAKNLNPEGMYLIDSGAHYQGGTTDITRTVHFGTPSAWQKELYTRVLIGHVDIAMTPFTNKTRGYQFDVLARRPLWEIGLDYLHGTGHGVGHSLEVHEAPPTITSRYIPGVTDSLMLPGMVVSNEPGVYLDGQFGIRIENLMYAEPNTTPHRFNGFQYLRFAQLTRVPYCRKLINTSLLSPKQIDWINHYHQEVLRLTTPFVKNMKVADDLKDYALKWLTAACAPL